MTRARSAVPKDDRTRRLALSGLFLLQGVCALFFAADVVLDILGWPGGQEQGGAHLLFEGLAAVALAMSVAGTRAELRRQAARERHVRVQLAAASGALVEVIEASFDSWGLTSSECDVAWLALKGLSITEIATARHTRPGTVKAQLNAIYRKAGVSGRAQLLSLFFEDLLEMGQSPAPA